MRSIAFVSYNPIGDTPESGWQEKEGRRALVLQNSKGHPWEMDKLSAQVEWRFGSGNPYVKAEIDELWAALIKVLPELDQVVIYLGAGGSEHAVELASHISPEKITFVACNCDIHEKRTLIDHFALGSVNQIKCECGGKRTMGELLSRFLVTGQLQS